MERDIRGNQVVSDLLKSLLRCQVKVQSGLAFHPMCVTQTVFMDIVITYFLPLWKKVISSYCNIFIFPFLLYQELSPHASFQPFLCIDYIITAFTMIEIKTHCALSFKLFHMCSFISPFTCSTWIVLHQPLHFITNLGQL